MVVNTSVLYDLLVSDIADAFPLGLRDFVLGEKPGDVRSPMGCSARQYAGAALLRSIFKKFKDEVDKEAADSEAYRRFEQANAVCASWQPPDVESLDPQSQVMLGGFQVALWDFFNPEGYSLLSHSVIERHVDFGPGSSPGAEDSSFLTKIGTSVLTAPNPFVVDLFYDWVRCHPTRVDCELARLLSSGGPEIRTALPLTAVLKTVDVSRLVKLETSLAMFFQKGIQAVYEGRLFDVFGIAFDDQPQINSELARCGSLDDSKATLDLKQASDYMAYKMLKHYMPKADFAWLDLFRSKYCLNQKGEETPLHMMGTMGNAFVFPLQTIIFACAVKAVYRALGIPLIKKKERFFASQVEARAYKWDEGKPSIPLLRNSLMSTPSKDLSRYPNFGVFGDDIVVEGEAFKPLTKLLATLGFVVNLDKSFENGYFRESCGRDWYCGEPVRGVYCKSLKTEQDRYTLINSLNDWSSMTNIHLPKVMSYLLASVERLEVPVWENPDAGIRMPLEVRTTPVHVCTEPTSPKAKARRKNSYQGSYRYQRWVPDVKGLNVAFEDAAEYYGFSNGSAVLLAAVKGALRAGRVVPRQEHVTYRKIWAIAPCWDYIPVGDDRSGRKANWMFASWVHYAL